MLRQIIVPILIVVVAVFAYMGAFLPVKKASMYIDTNKQTRSFNSLTELKQEFDKVFEYSSPIGDQEVRKFFMTNILSIIKNQPKPVAEELISYIESRMIEDEFLHVLSVANMYNITWQKFGDDKFFDGAEKYYLKAHEMGPKVPQPLFNLYDIYKKNNQPEKAEDIGQKIMDLWPEIESLEELNVNLR